MTLQDKTIVLGICGSIAAYRSADFIRDCQRAGASKVLPLLSEWAPQFVTPLTLQAISHQPVYSQPMAMAHDGTPVHIAMAQQGDVYVVWAATADMLAKMAQGLTGDLVSCTFITFTDQPVVIVPAMNTRMWQHPITQRNVATLKALPNVTFVPPSSGYLSCGEIGEGHLASHDTVIQTLTRVLSPKPYAGVRAVVTAGGTQEPLDPVRVLTNRSSGQMGLALADALWQQGAEVTLVATPVLNGLERPYPISYTPTALAMQAELEARFETTDLLVMAAAVSDFRPAHASSHKLKRPADGEVTLALAPNPEILVGLGQRRRPATGAQSQYMVGFAAETQDWDTHAQAKLSRKNLDAIVVNDVSRSDIGFEATHNEVTLWFADGTSVQVAKQPKPDVAQAILQSVAERWERIAQGAAMAVTPNRAPVGH
jgi:phosphopantothenoylcysteine decarboxylase/phosphopantothenate--cysteine ligase